MSYTYCVITKVPNSWDGNDGNLASASFAHHDDKRFPDSDLYMVSHTYGGSDETKEEHLPRAVTWQEMDKVLPNDRYGFYIPVFTLGEICILDEPNGREVSGKQRAPRKWFVEVEEFDNIEDAVKRAQEVLKEESEDILKRMELK